MLRQAWLTFYTHPPIFSYTAYTVQSEKDVKIRTKNTTGLVIELFTKKEKVPIKKIFQPFMA